MTAKERIIELLKNAQALCEDTALSGGDVADELGGHNIGKSTIASALSELKKDGWIDGAKLENIDGKLVYHYWIGDAADEMPVSANFKPAKPFVAESVVIEDEPEHSNANELISYTVEGGDVYRRFIDYNDALAFADMYALQETTDDMEITKHISKVVLRVKVVSQVVHEVV